MSDCRDCLYYCEDTAGTGHYCNYYDKNINHRGLEICDRFSKLPSTYGSCEEVKE